MKSVLLSIFVLVAAATPLGAQDDLREVDLKVRGVGSGSSYRSVIAKFGPPLKRKVERFSADNFSCVPPAHTLMKLNYPGLTFELLGDGQGRDLKIVEILVTSGRWSASGIRIGATEREVERRFGKPGSRERKDGRVIYYYVTPGNFGGVSFEFRKARLAKILMIETLC